MENINFNKEIDNLNNITIKIFNLIKLQDWVNLHNLIKLNNIDYNIKDNSNVYLLEYLINFNQIDIIKDLLEKNIRIDITDDNNKSVLYTIIKYSYIEILELFIKKNKSIIGKNIFEIQDNEDNIPLFYALKFFNIECIKLIIKNMDNLFLQNKYGDNVLHLAVKSQNLDIFKIIIDKVNYILTKNNSGENIIHVIIRLKCYGMFKYLLKKFTNDEILIKLLNLQENKFNLTPLHYICIYLDNFFLKTLLDDGYLKYIKPNIQDNSGNIFYHYFINNILSLDNLNWEQISSILEMNEIISKFDFNINLYNINGNTPCHLLTNNLDFFLNNKLNIIINYVLNKADLNIQNYNGESVLFLLIKNNYWKNVKNILIHKKLDIFIITNDNKNIIELIDDLDDFLIIVTKSYINQLDDGKWNDYWDNKCKQNINPKKLTAFEKNKLKKLNINYEKEDNLCFKIIYNKINKFIDIFKKSKNRYEINSFPVENTLKKLIDNYPNVVLSTFTGSTLDVLNGLIYLSLKFNNPKKKLLDSSLKLMDLDISIINCNIIEYDNKICEISGFEILWKNQLLYIPSSKKNDLFRQINFMINSSECRFFIIPIGIELINENNNICSHANYLIWDLHTREVERFEPHGSDSPHGLDYNPKLLDSQLENKINLLNLDFKYIRPEDYLPKISFQIKEINELKNDYIGDPNGFCALWCIWWCDLRISNYNIPRKELVYLLNQELINGNHSYKKLIRDYSYYITNLRDSFLKKSNTNINEWINDKISQKNINILQNLLINQIIKLY